MKLDKSENYYFYYEKYSYFIVALKYKRLRSFFYFNVLLPIFLITSLVFSCYAIDISDYSDRLNVSIIVLLTLAAFRFSLQESLPKLSYLTVFDKYNITGLIFVIFECVFDFIISIEESNENYDTNKEADYIFHILIFRLWSLFSLTFLAFNSIIEKKIEPYQLLKEELNSQKFYLPQAIIYDQVSEDKTQLIKIEQNK